MPASDPTSSIQCLYDSIATTTATIKHEYTSYSYWAHFIGDKICITARCRRQRHRGAQQSFLIPTSLCEIENFEFRI